VPKCRQRDGGLLAPEERPSSGQSSRRAIPLTLKRFHRPNRPVPDESSVPAIPASAKAPAESLRLRSPAKLSPPREPQMNPPKPKPPYGPGSSCGRTRFNPCSRAFPTQRAPTRAAARRSPRRLPLHRHGEKIPHSKTDRPAFSSRKLLTPLTPALPSRPVDEGASPGLRHCGAAAAPPGGEASATCPRAVRARLL